MNPQLNAFLAQLRIVLIIIGTLMAEQGFDHSTFYKWIMVGSGTIVVFGNALWALWSTFTNWWKAAAVGAAAGIAMTAQGKALDHDGNAISAFSPEAETPPLPVTISSAKDIVKEFAPPTASIAKA